jgi:hypothetical protein
MRRWVSVTGVLLLVLVAGAPSCSKKDPKLPGVVARPPQTDEITNLPVVEAVQPCPNWAWAAGLEMLLNAQGVRLEQRHWVLKANGGEVCVARLSPEELVRVIDGDYALESGRKIRLTGRWQSGAIAPDDVIMAARRKRPVMLFWHGHPYVAYGAVYNEFIASTGHRMFEISEIKLYDPAGVGDLRYVSFQRGRDDVADIQGIMDVEVADRAW